MNITPFWSLLQAGKVAKNSFQRRFSDTKRCFGIFFFKVNVLLAVETNFAAVGRRFSDD